MGVLVTGATGIVGGEIMKSLAQSGVDTIAAVRREDDLHRFAKAIRFDFADARTWEGALQGVDKVFLMRPPAISDVKTSLFPFIDTMLARGVKQIVFLSLQGVQFNPLIPHYKVEKYMRNKGALYTFLRPNFFMQNLTTFYRSDIAERDEIYLPAGKGRTAFIDVRDISTVAAKVLSENGHIGRAYTLSGSEALDYYQVAETLSRALGRQITYKNPSVDSYLARLRSKGAKEEFIKVQKMLYFVVRHNFSAGVVSRATELLGRTPISFQQFTEDNVAMWNH